MAPRWFENLFDDEESTRERTFGDECASAFHVSLANRLVAFVACVVTGFVISAGSLLVLFHPVKFAVLYTLGNMLSIGSSMFLRGPSKHCSTMFAEKRRMATGILLACMAATLTVALWKGSAMLWLVIVLVCVQCLALAWYTLSYIPYARTAVKSAVASVVKV
jgi:hypothetical protein